MTKLALVLTTLTLLFVASIPLYAATAADYPYQIPVTITNESGSTLDAQVCVELNAPQLIAAGFLDASALQAGGFDPASAEVGLVRQSITDASSCWFIASGSLLDGQVGTQSIRVGSASPSTDNVQNLHLPSPSQTATASDAASLDLTNYLTLEMVGVSFEDFPTTLTPVLFKGTSAYGLQINAGGIPSFKTTLVGGGCPPTRTITGSSALVAGTAYDLRATWAFDSPFMSLYLYVDDVQVASEVLGLTCTIGTNASVVTLVPATGSMDVAQVRIGSTDVTTPTWVMDWSFEPANMTLTQKGSTGNAWAWIQTVGDAALSNDATIAFTRDLSGVTVVAEALQDTSATAFADIAYAPADMIGTLPGLNVKNATSEFTGDDALDEVINFTGLTSDGGYFGFLVLIASMLGALVVTATKQPALGVGILGASVGVGGVLGWFGFLYVVVGLVMCFGIAGSAALLGKK